MRYQGLGLGSRTADALGELMRIGGHNFSAKGAHPVFGLYRNRSPLWVAQSGNGKFDPKVKKTFTSHRFIGHHNAETREKLYSRVIIETDL